MGMGLERYLQFNCNGMPGFHNPIILRNQSEAGSQWCDSQIHRFTELLDDAILDSANREAQSELTGVYKDLLRQSKVSVD